MDKFADLKDLLRHEVEDLYSAEQQIIDALPAMIAKARHPKLKQALQQHLEVTREQQQRLNKVQEILQPAASETDTGKKAKGFLSRIFGGTGVHKCKGTEGLIQEGEQVMGEDMDPDVMDAAIIASAQKIEHYEICGYGTARAYARELKLAEVEALLTATLNEEYEADDLLTTLAVQGGVNRKAEGGAGSGNRPKARVASDKKPSSAAAKKRPVPKKAASKKGAGRKAG